MKSIYIVRIKKTFRKHQQYWYNGEAGMMLFVQKFKRGEYRVMRPVTTTNLGLRLCACPTAYFVRTKDVQVLGEIKTPQNTFIQ